MSEELVLLSDLYNVGKVKSVGYLPLTTLTKTCSTPISAIIDYANNNNLKVIVLHWCRVKSGAIYLYSEDMLTELLRKQSYVLNSANIPCNNSLKFIKYIAKKAVSAAKYPLAFAVIAKCFNDKRF